MNKLTKLEKILLRLIVILGVLITFNSFMLLVILLT